MSGSLSRRAFLACGSSLVGLGAIAGVLPGAVVTRFPALPGQDLGMRRSAFLPLVGETFEIVHDQGSLSVVLYDISDLQPAVQPGAEEQFSLIFTDDRLRPALPQGTYALSHARRGPIAMFLAPVDRRQTTQSYQAIVNNPSLALLS